MRPTLPFTRLDDLEAWLAAMGDITSAEGVSELAHGLQCAAELAAAKPDDEALQIAGLLHDVCHGLCHIRHHDALGGEAVKQLVGPRVAELVALHVDAKRYLVVTDPLYASRLSKVSTATLALEGGPMTAEEVAAFDRNPLRDDAILLRFADEAGKVDGRDVPGLDHWLPILRRVAAAV